MLASRMMSFCRWSPLLLLAVLCPVKAQANPILTNYAPAQYYGAGKLAGNLESVTGLWVSAAEDPLAYIYGYIPGINDGGGPYFGSGNFALIPVLLADPLLTLPELSLILGNTSLPAGGSVLDLTAAVTAYRSGGVGGGQIPAVTPEPGTVWLAILGGLAVGVTVRGSRRRLG